MNRPQKRITVGLMCTATLSLVLFVWSSRYANSLVSPIWVDPYHLGIYPRKWQLWKHHYEPDWRVMGAIWGWLVVMYSCLMMIYKPSRH